MKAGRGLWVSLSSRKGGNEVRAGQVMLSGATVGPVGSMSQTETSILSTHQSPHLPRASESRGTSKVSVDSGRLQPGARRAGKPGRGEAKNWVREPQQGDVLPGCWAPPQHSAASGSTSRTPQSTLQEPHQRRKSADPRELCLHPH